jgi:hypothetical protein
VALLLATLLLAAPLLAGCLPTQATFEPGLGTGRISGSLRIEREAPPHGGLLIVVLQQHHQFVTRDEDGSAVLRAGAQVLQPGRAGGFVIHVPGDVVAMDVLFIAAEHLTEVFHFRRQVGMGDIHYQARLPYTADWRSHYYTFLSSQLEYLITEPRYRLDPAGQRLLGQWLQAQNERLGGPEPTAPREEQRTPEERR